MQALQQGRSDVFENLDCYQWIACGEVVQQSGQQIGSDGRDNADDHLAPLIARHLAKLGLSFLQLAENAFRLGQERPAEHRQLGRARQAIEESGAQLRFEFQNLLRKRWLCDVLDLGSTRERAVASHCTEIPKLVNFHWTSLKFPRRKNYRIYRKDIFYVCIARPEYERHGKRISCRSRK